MRFFLLVIFFFQCAIISAQTSGEFQFRKINDEVLGGAEISRLFPTTDGLVWFGTNKGLASFDGSEIVNYGNNGQAIAFGDRIFDLCEDKNGNLWFTTIESGLIYFNRQSGTFRKIELSINHEITSSDIFFGKVYVDRQGIVWVGTGDRGFFSYDPKTNVSHHYHFKPEKPSDWTSRYENTARNFLQDARDSNIIWIANYGTGLYSFNKMTGELKINFNNADKKYNSWRSRCITGLFQLNDSTIWFHTWGYGMGEYNTKTGFYKCYLRNPGPRLDYLQDGHIIEYAAQKSDSEFYIAPRDTIPAIFNIHTKRFTFIHDADLDKEYQQTTNVRVGHHGVLYFVKGGSLFVSSPRYQLFKEIHLGDKIGTVYSELNCMIWNASTQRYYAGILLGNGVNEYDKDFHLIRTIPMPFYTGKGFLNTTVIWKLHRDKANHLWALGFITCVYDSASQRFIPVKKKWPHLKLLDSAMNDVSEDKNGMLYFNSSQNELITLDPFLLTEHKIVSAGNKPPGNFFFYDDQVLSDTERNYIYFSFNKNLYQYNTLTGKIRILYIDSSYYNNPLAKYECSYTLGTDGVLWLSSPDRHLWKIDPHSFKITDTVKLDKSYIDFSGARFYGAYHEYLLISTYKSQILFNTITRQSIYLDRNNGLILNRPAKEMYCDDRVFYSFASVGKAQYAAIESLLQDAIGPTPYFYSILVNNQPYLRDSLPQNMKKLVLNYDQNSISIAYSAIETAFPERLEFAYKLSKSQEEWFFRNNVNRQITFANLAPGNYVFSVKARKWGGAWSPETKLFIFITPPFWRTWWFIASVFILILALVIWVVQWRINSIRKHEQLRSKHEKELLELEARALRAQMNPHFIFNCLNSIKSLIQQKNDDHAVRYLTTFSKLIRIIFQNSDQREISLYDEIETCKLYTQLEGMRYGKRINYHFNIDDSLDLKSVRVPALIVQPFIENAIWHGIMPRSGEGTVNVSVKECDHSICCIIDDDGIGRELSMQNKFLSSTPDHQSKGIHLTQSRLDLDNTLNTRNASIKITDKKDDQGKPAGTTVLLTFKEY